MERIWDYTAISTFQKCQMKFYWHMVRHLVPRTTAPALEFGQAIHLALESYYTDGLDKAVEVFRATFKDREGEDKRTVANGVKALVAYSLVYKHEPFKMIGKPEQGFVFPIGDYLYGGRVDLPVEWNGELWVLEHKTTTWLTSSYTKQFDLSAQVMGYTIAAEEMMGKKCMGCVINVIEPWRELKRPTAKSKKPEDHFLRYPVAKTQKQKDEFKVTTPKIIEDIRKCEEKGEFHPDGMFSGDCFAYNYDCPYKDLCKFGEDSRIIARDFKIEPWAPYAVEEVKK